MDVFLYLSFLLFAKQRAGSYGRKISIKVQLRAVMQNRPYILALIGQKYYSDLHFMEEMQMFYIFHL